MTYMEYAPSCKDQADAEPWKIGLMGMRMVCNRSNFARTTSL